MSEFCANVLRNFIEQESSMKQSKVGPYPLWKRECQMAGTEALSQCRQQEVTGNKSPCEKDQIVMVCQLDSINVSGSLCKCPKNWTDQTMDWMQRKPSR